MRIHEENVDNRAGPRVRRLKYAGRARCSGVPVLDALGPALLLEGAAGGADEPRGAQQEEEASAAQEGPGEEPPMRRREEAGEEARVAAEEGLGELAQGEHEGPHARVVLDDEAQVRVQVHLGEEVGVLALRDEPALALELGGHGLVGLVELAEPVEARDAGDGDGAERDQGDQEFRQHARRSQTRSGGQNGRLYTSPFYITGWSAARRRWGRR